MPELPDTTASLTRAIPLPAANGGRRTICSRDTMRPAVWADPISNCWRRLPTLPVTSPTLEQRADLMLAF